MSKPVSLMGPPPPENPEAEAFGYVPPAGQIPESEFVRRCWLVGLSAETIYASTRLTRGDLNYLVSRGVLPPRNHRRLPVGQAVDHGGRLRFD